MDNTINVTRLARQIAERAIPKPKTAEDKAALRLADHPIDKMAAENFRQFDFKDQGTILHRVRKGVARLQAEG